VQEREALFNFSQKKLQRFAAEQGCNLLHTPGNPISMAMTLDGLSQRHSLPLSAYAGARGGEAAISDTPVLKITEEADPRSSDTSQSGGGVSGNSTPLGEADAGRFDSQAIKKRTVRMEGVPERRTDGVCVKATDSRESGPASQEVVAESARFSAAEPCDSLRSGSEPRAEALPITFLGSMLFHRCVSGTRVIGRGKVQAVEGITFQGYGAHCDDYPHDYLTVAAALGTEEADIDEFCLRLRKCFLEFRKKESR
jgi:hypothetical protein